jgi:hypothetical protein
MNRCQTRAELKTLELRNKRKRHKHEQAHLSPIVGKAVDACTPNF